MLSAGERVAGTLGEESGEVGVGVAGIDGPGVCVCLHCVCDGCVDITGE